MSEREKRREIKGGRRGGKKEKDVVSKKHNQSGANQRLFPKRSQCFHYCRCNLSSSHSHYQRIVASQRPRLIIEKKKKKKIGLEQAQQC